MFKKDRPYQNIESIIAAGVEIKGDVAAQGSIRVDGAVEGKLNLKGDLVLGEKAHIKGEIRVNNIILAGKVEGTVHAGGRLEITSTGQMNGDIICSSISIEEGGILQGSSRMSMNKEKSEVFVNKRTQRQDSEKG
ncbi:bactofilin family protein [Syntrophomonas palmitatica]|uniref:bactofilin family protein n=1 Tax=Syntrophomonas palmitatica TaxID=402877 RepID=UPI0006D1084B|nr:polymer-forming cytoskeletal protein [Syntrophomonas palmitatica]